MTGIRVSPIEAVALTNIDLLVGEHWRIGVLILNAAACFSLMIAFVYRYALPQFNRYIFEASVEFVDSLPCPSMIITLLGSSTVTKITNATAFYFYANGSFADCSSALQFHNGNIVPTFDPSLLSSENQRAALNDRLIFDFEVTCRISCLSQIVVSANSDSS